MKRIVFLVPRKCKIGGVEGLDFRIMVSDDVLSLMLILFIVWNLASYSSKRYFPVLALL